MMKTWQRVCNVPMKSFVLELLAMEFLSSYQYASNSAVYFDWMTRDFFGWLKDQSQWHAVIVPGTYEMIYIGDDWRSRAESAYKRAVEATNLEVQGYKWLAGAEWQKIFGDDIPSG
jgi:hypothetical protein